MNKQQYYVLWIANLIVFLILFLSKSAFNQGIAVILFSGVLIFSLSSDLGKIVGKKVILYFSIIVVVCTIISGSVSWFEKRKRDKDFEKRRILDWITNNRGGELSYCFEYNPSDTKYVSEMFRKLRPTNHFENKELDTDVSE